MHTLIRPQVPGPGEPRLLAAPRRDAAIAVAVVALTACIFVAVGDHATLASIQRQDDAWLGLMVSGRTAPLTAVAKVFNVVGLVYVTLPVWIAIAGFLALRRWWWHLAAFAAAVAIAEALIGLLKGIYDRPRPPGSLVATSGASFPSGHSVAASVTVVAAVIALVPAGRRRAWWGAAAVMFSILMALSRAYLGAHWLSDAVAGILLGTSCALVTALVAGQVQRPPRQPARAEHRVVPRQAGRRWARTRPRRTHGVESPDHLKDMDLPRQPGVRLCPGAGRSPARLCAARGRSALAGRLLCRCTRGVRQSGLRFALMAAGSMTMAFGDRVKGLQSRSMRVVFSALLGRRPPMLDGSLAADVGAEVAIRRDGYGIPHIDAASDADAWYGLGFCYGQDRAFQMEMFLRVTRGTLAALIGKDGLPVDRLARRIGFRQAAQAQLPMLDADIRTQLESFAAGFNAGVAKGGRRMPHEFALLRARPTPCDAADLLAVLKLYSFTQAMNWDMELARWLILRADGPGALQAIDPSYPPWLPVTAPPGVAAGPAIDRLRVDIAALAGVTGGAGGSNCWVLAGSRTASGRPLLAADPHLLNDLPSPGYLAHLRTAEWEAAGLTLGPVFVAGHNGHAAWGETNGYADNSDLFIEEVGRDEVSVRRGGEFVPCEVREETIEVRGADPVVEKVLVTSHGPVIGPALGDEVGAVALRATWLTPAPLRGQFAIHRAKDFETFRRCFDRWPAISLNYLYADVTGTIGWQLAGDVPQRRSGWGLLPAPGWDLEAGWLDNPVPFDAMPHAVNPGCGFLATANNKPVADDEHGPFLGADWIDGFRVKRITDMLASRRDWDIPSTQRLQLDVHSVLWDEVREVILALPANDPVTRSAHDLLAGWDGNLEADSPAATVFEELIDEFARRLATAATPHSAATALGAGFHPLVPATLLGLRRRGRLARALRASEADRAVLGLTADDTAAALATVTRRLVDTYGRDRGAWARGRVQPLSLHHPLGQRRPLDRVFDRGPLPGRGGPDTIAQYTVSTFAPGKAVIPSARIVIDVGDWDAARFAIPGGQSGNPLSAHYDDLLQPWRDGHGIPLPWTKDAVLRATAHMLRLFPGRRPAGTASSAPEQRAGSDAVAGG